METVNVGRCHSDLCGEILGHIDLGAMAFLQLTGRMPNANEARMFNALAITLVEHGITPSAIAARMPNRA